MFRFLSFFMVLSFFMLVSCEQTDEQALKDAEKASLNTYISTKKISVAPTASGLYYIQGKTGIGTQVVSGATVQFHYKAYLIDGTVFDTTEGKAPFSIKIGESSLVKGLEEGLLLMREGDTATLIMPSSLAYGSVRNGPIPAYSTLIFEVEIVKVTK
jgi:FKBP-type peptidyl-prolyl cis-trans isomerase